MNEFNKIDGLRWEARFRLENGTNSFVVPFPTLQPINIVYHGAKKFDYGHYGIHLGQEDRLTFMGDSQKKIKAFFIDCREKSKTKGQRIITEFSPTTARTLCIPPGVAHSFEGLEDVVTLNSYESFLPDPEIWARGLSKWNMKNDVVNVPMDIRDEELPFFYENPHQPSSSYYELLAQRQREAFANQNIEYPLTQDLDFPKEGKVRVMLKKRNESSESSSKFKSVPEIKGVGWSYHPVIRSGENSGFVPLIEERPLYIVDHGEEYYTHDAYGIHLGQEDRLTFTGAEHLKAFVTLVDCRKNSPTLHKKVRFEFQPDATRCLVIPPGVAHAFENMENIYTINQPRIFLDANLSYDSGNDVIDWPTENENYPVLQTNRIEAWRETYERQAQGQKSQMQRPPRHSTPIVHLVRGAEGKYMKVALRKRSVG
jgi:dTDP-4-dehydrorhamnose 3,5-epimerase-like enzyme